MALKRLTIDGYGQLELNAVAFRRSGRIEAQCALDVTDFTNKACENGMLLAVDNINRVIRLADEEGANFPIALNYSTEHMYDERHNALKDFAIAPNEQDLKAKNYFYPRMGYLGAGDKFTTNCICYDTSEFSISTEDTEEAELIKALGEIKATKLYGKRCAEGAIQVTKSAEGADLLVIAKTTMPDGQLAVKFQAL